MKIKGMIPTKVRHVGKKETGVVLKKDVIELCGLKIGDSINITVLENGSLLIEKRR